MSDTVVTSVTAIIVALLASPFLVPLIFRKENRNVSAHPPEDVPTAMMSEALSALRESLHDRDERIDELAIRRVELEVEVNSERAISIPILRYLRQLLRWIATLPPEIRATVPKAPEEIEMFLEDR